MRAVTHHDEDRGFWTTALLAGAVLLVTLTSVVLALWHALEMLLQRLHF